MPFTFGKQEHLKSEKSISLLINKGFSYIIFPLKIHWMLVPKSQNVTIKCAFGVPKKKFKKAVTRNYIRRIMREVYRTNKEILINTLNEKGLKMQFILTYIGDDIPAFQQIESKIILTLHHLIKLHETSMTI